MISTSLNKHAATQTRLRFELSLYYAIAPLRTALLNRKCIFDVSQNIYSTFSISRRKKKNEIIHIRDIVTAEEELIVLLDILTREIFFSYSRNWMYIIILIIYFRRANSLRLDGDNEGRICSGRKSA